jgi:hypothetical protein
LFAPAFKLKLAGTETVVALAPPVVAIVGGLGTEVTAVIFAEDLLVTCSVSVNAQLLGVELTTVHVITSDFSAQPDGILLFRVFVAPPLVVKVARTSRKSSVVSTVVDHQAIEIEKSTNAPG